jgi:uncharacterized protein
MPANLTPDYLAADERFKKATTVREKIAALEDMLRLIPKHKGTDRLQGELKARLAVLRRTPEKKGVRAGFSWHIPAEGAGQVALVGLPNTGKSSLVAALTRAEPEVGDWPGTTREPTPGMMPWQDVAFQLIDLPPLDAGHTEPWVFDLARRADLVWLVVSGDEPLTGVEDGLAMLSARNLRFHPARGGPPPEDVPGRDRSQPLLVVATGLDRPATADNVAALGELLDVPWPLHAVSTVTREGLEELAALTFRALRIVRVYTKAPGKPPDKVRPFTLPLGATVGDLAERIHKEVLAGLKSARLWGSGAFDGQTVHRSHVLSDGDVVELKT